jgi:hypothetical protein
LFTIFSGWIPERSSAGYIFTSNQCFWYQPVISNYSTIPLFQ